MIDIKKYVKVKSGSQDMVLDQVLENGDAHEVVIEPLNITPSKSAQSFTPPQGIDGYAPVSVSAVTASIDENIVSGNIKSGVNILGVEGNVVELQGEERTVSITSSAGETITPSSGKNGITSITVTPALETGTATPMTFSYTLAPSSNKCGFSSISVPAVTASIDSNIQAGNIKQGVSILGVEGTAQLAPAHYIEKRNVDGVLYNSTNVMDFSGVESIGSMVLYSAYYYNSNVTGVVNMSSLKTISSSQTQAAKSCFYACTNITEVNLSGLETVYGQFAFETAFSNCLGIVTVKLDSLQKIRAYYATSSMFTNCSNLENITINNLTFVGGSNGARTMFGNCVKIATADLSKLAIIEGNYDCGNMFAGCTSLSDVDLSSLYYIGNNGASYMFSGCTSLPALFLPALRTVTSSSLTNMLSGVSNCMVHLPSNLSSNTDIAADVAAGFGGTNTIVLFSLPATNILTGVNSVSYQRNPKYDTGTALAWRVQDTGTMPNITIDWTPFYTDASSAITVGTTIYSDSALTTAVTTVDSIA